MRTSTLSATTQARGLLAVIDILAELGRLWAEIHAAENDEPAGGEAAGGGNGAQAGASDGDILS